MNLHSPISRSFKLNFIIIIGNFITSLGKVTSFKKEAILQPPCEALAQQFSMQKEDGNNWKQRKNMKEGEKDICKKLTENPADDWCVAVLQEQGIVQ